MAEKMRKGKFDLEDLSEQLAQVEKLGGMGGIMGMLPGMGKIKEQMASANIDERIIKRQRAIISSMTRGERRNPDLLKASRKKRIAAGSGTKVEDVNRLLKQHRQMADMMKSLGGAKRGGALGKMASALGMGRQSDGRHARADARAARGAGEASSAGARRHAEPSGGTAARRLRQQASGRACPASAGPAARARRTAGGFNPFGGRKK